VNANCARANTTASQPSNIPVIRRRLIVPPDYHAIRGGDIANARIPASRAVSDEGAARSRNHSAGSVEQPRNGAVDLLVLAFAVVLEHDLSALIDDVLRRLILVAIGVTGLLFIVLRDRIGNAMTFERCLHVGGGSIDR